MKHWSAFHTLFRKDSPTVRSGRGAPSMQFYPHFQPIWFLSTFYRNVHDFACNTQKLRLNVLWTYALMLYHISLNIYWNRTTFFSLLRILFHPWLEHDYCANRSTAMIASVSSKADRGEHGFWLFSSAVLHRGCLMASMRTLPKQSKKQQTKEKWQYWEQCGVVLLQI